MEDSGHNLKSIGDVNSMLLERFQLSVESNFSSCFAFALLRFLIG